MTISPSNDFASDPGRECLVAALYKFVPVDQLETLQLRLKDVCLKARVKGTLLLASEGLNGTIAGPEAGVRAVLEYLRSDPRFTDLVHKESWTSSIPFGAMKVRLKKEIVTLGVPGVDPREVVGTYVEPTDWNALISAEDVILIDTRNDYEFEVGSFEDAIDPGTESFRDFPAWLETQQLQPNTRIAMFCTGGIRCEKATSYMRARGYENVFHLQGGILKYLEEVPETESLWRGECFVFDERVTVNHRLEPGSCEGP
jgi:UPF0176 protein